jgi:hypothetical protein
VSELYFLIIATIFAFGRKKFEDTKWTSKQKPYILWEQENHSKLNVEDTNISPILVILLHCKIKNVLNKYIDKLETTKICLG